jgi:hypothetical protein
MMIFITRKFHDERLVIFRYRSLLKQYYSTFNRNTNLEVSILQDLSPVSKAVPVIKISSLCGMFLHLNQHMSFR